MYNTFEKIEIYATMYVATLRSSNIKKNELQWIYKFNFEIIDKKSSWYSESSNIIPELADPKGQNYICTY